jgi:release factor glutamine methyltransferase
MDARQTLINLSQFLNFHNIEDPQVEARILLCHVLEMSTEQLFASPDTVLSEAQVKKVLELADRRINCEPSSYITGKKEFYGLDFYINSHVLIPRPETELLVEEVRKSVAMLRSTDPYKRVTIVDVGTGCGAIAISLAKYLDAYIYAIDISPDALNVARINCERHGVSDKVHLLQGNLLEPLKATLDILVANLPYVATDEMKQLGSEIKDYEPSGALEGGVDGLDQITRLLSTCKQYLSVQAVIILEFGNNQMEKIDQLINMYFPGSKRSFLKDLAGLDRAVSIIL